MQAELRKAGADISTTANVEAWESILAAIGVEEAREVPRVVYDLAMEFERVSGAKLPRPYLAALVSNGSAAAAAKLAARRDLDHRTHQRKESA